MPEGHTIHRLARDLNRGFAGGPVAASSPQGRFAAGAAAIDGRELQKAEAHGKHLFLRFDPETFVHVHLGLYGKFSVTPPPVTPPVGQVRLRLVGEKAFADLRGAPACELVDSAARSALLARLGPDPLRRDADPEPAWRRISRSRSPIAGLLMDQSVLCGVGNVYRAEVLFRHGVDPYLPGRDLPREVWDAMWGDLVELLHVGLRRGRIVTMAPTVVAPPATSERGRRRWVYRRAGEPCVVCGTAVLMEELAARNLYWCPVCQAPGSVTPPSEEAQLPVVPARRPRS